MNVLKRAPAAELLAKKVESEEFVAVPASAAPAAAAAAATLDFEAFKGTDPARPRRRRTAPASRV